jgi:predicted AAA+ superfamily ATPase
MQRIYDTIAKQHLEEHRQMLFLVGPRQVGKTTTTLNLKNEYTNYAYFNWDDIDTQKLILKGPKAIIESANLTHISEQKTVLVFDEIHKFIDWRNFLKGFFDTHHETTSFVITGSTKLDFLRRSGDSLMGRYIPYRLHPITLAETERLTLSDGIISPPTPSPPDTLNSLLNTGGFPEPFLSGNQRFCQQWQRLKHQQLFQGDLRELSRIQELSHVELLASLLTERVGQLINFDNLAKTIRVSGHSIRKWIDTLRSVYYCFLIKPWAKNVTRSLLKQPKAYLWDWSLITDEGAKKENFIASHLLKAVHLWTDYGFGEFNLYFIRDKEQREVDFLVTKDNEPWFLVEVKSGGANSISEHLYRFQEQTGAKHAFQVAFDLPYVDKDCFSYTQPVIVPASTFLSQLI